MDKWTKNLKKEWIYRRTTDPLCCTPETNTILEIKYAPIIFKIKKKIHRLKVRNGQSFDLYFNLSLNGLINKEKTQKNPLVLKKRKSQLRGR